VIYRVELGFLSAEGSQRSGGYRGCVWRLENKREVDKKSGCVEKKSGKEWREAPFKSLPCFAALRAGGAEPAAGQPPTACSNTD